jgi:hypothetical protein
MPYLERGSRSTAIRRNKRPIGDKFPGRPARRIDAAAQLVDLALRYFDSERPDRALRARSRGVANYRVLPVRVRWASCRSSSVAASKRTSLDDHRAEVQVAVEDEYRLPRVRLNLDI